MSTTFSPGSVARMGLEQALKRQAMTEKHEDPKRRLWQCEEFCRYWSTGIAEIDAFTGGGFYGFSVIGADGKIGKSTLALSSALEAAASLRWQVKYFNAELRRSETQERLERYIEKNPAAEDGLALFDLYHVGRGTSPEELTVLASESPGEEPLLIVLDSINTISTLADGHYLDALRNFSLWATLAQRDSDGACAFLVVAETNTRGGIKGEQLKFWADLVLRMSGKPEDGFVDLEITHSRSTPARPFGRFLRHTPTGRFLKEHQIPRPRVVGYDG